MTMAEPSWMSLLLGAVRGPAWRSLGYLSLGVPISVLTFAAATLAVSFGLQMALLVIGVPVTLACLAIVRSGAGLERWLAGLVTRRPVASPYQAVHGPWLTRLRGRLADPATWRDFWWLVPLFPLRLLTAATSWTMWAAGLGCFLLPLWFRFLPDGRADLSFGPGHVYAIDSVIRGLPMSVLGLFICLCAGWTTRWMASRQASLAASLLGPDHTAQLRQRVAELSTTRSAAANAQATELRRIERDLHDGAQARLVAMGADLGLAAEAFDTDPSTARALLHQARSNAEQALTELRDLVHGIAPPILADRGLAGSLEALAARSAVPVRLTVEIEERPPAAVESAVYFLVAEGLTNIARHAAARSATVDVSRDGDQLAVRIADDGRGGADLEAGTGLRGLRERLGALDGALSVSSPPGGPTVLLATVPCGS